jgi:hypothetical protein
MDIVLSRSPCIWDMQVLIVVQNATKSFFIQYSFEDVALFLLKKGARLDWKHHDGRDLLAFASLHPERNCDIIEMLNSAKQENE